MGVTALTLLIVASVATYVKVVTVRISLMNDWVSFVPALLLASFVYYISLYLSNHSIEYLDLLKDSFFTFIFYPVLWAVFLLISNLIKS